MTTKVDKTPTRAGWAKVLSRDDKLTRLLAAVDETLNGFGPVWVRERPELLHLQQARAAFERHKGE